MVDATDDADGWIQLEGRPVTVPMYNPPGSTAVVNVSQSNFLRTFDLFELNSPAITALHPAKMPAGLPKADAGRSLLASEKEPPIVSKNSAICSAEYFLVPFSISEVASEAKPALSVVSAAEPAFA